MKALLVSPPYPKTYWGMEYTRKITAGRALLAPLGLLTVAALLPPSWEIRLVDRRGDGRNQAPRVNPAAAPSHCKPPPRAAVGVASIKRARVTRLMTLSSVPRAHLTR